MKLLITGGGTGGHVNPGIAIAKYFKKRHKDAEIKFAGTVGGIETKLVPRAGFSLYELKIRGFSREKSLKAIGKNLKILHIAISSLKHAKNILKDFRPDCVIGTGGYASFPMVYAAQKLGIPTVILEVNALAGVTTKVLSKKADRVYITFDESRKHLKRQDNIEVTGAPMSEELAFMDKDEARAKLGIPKGEKLVVSFWGSMGALHMNNHMVDFLEIANSKKEFYHIHAMGAAASKWLPQKLSDRGVDLKKNPKIDLREYIYDMNVVMAAADLVICRAGAATMAELCLMGKASIIVPSPYVAENHQEKNARALEKKGGCNVITELECSGEILYNSTVMLLQDREKLELMEKNAKLQAKPYGADEIYKNIMEIIKK